MANSLGRDADTISFLWHLSDYLYATMRDRASVNSVAMKTVKIIYPNTCCFSYAFDSVGGHFNIPTLTISLEIGYFFFHTVLKLKFVETADRQLNGII